VNKLIFVILAAATLAACETYDPDLALEARVTRAADANNRTVTNTLSTVGCPHGMVPVTDRARVSTDTKIRYEEDRRNRNHYYSSYRYDTDAERRARTNSSGERELGCGNPSVPPGQ